MRLEQLEPKQRAHSSLLAAGSASKLKIDAIPYGRRFPVACCGELQFTSSSGRGRTLSRQVKSRFSLFTKVSTDGY